MIGARPTKPTESKLSVKIPWDTTVLYDNTIIINKSIFKAQNLVPRDYFKRIHTRAHTDRGTRTHKHYFHTKLKYTQLKTGSKRRERERERERESSVV